MCLLLFLFFAFCRCFLNDSISCCKCMSAFASNSNIRCFSTSLVFFLNDSNICCMCILFAFYLSTSSGSCNKCCKCLSAFACNSNIRCFSASLFGFPLYECNICCIYIFSAFTRAVSCGNFSILFCSSTSRCRSSDIRRCTSF